jgi:hypothetical protein
MGRYILGLGKNDKTEVLDIHNLPLAEGVWDAMAQMRALVIDRLHGPHKIEVPLEHIILRPSPGEKLTRAQYAEMINAVLKRLGYKNCPWVRWEDVLHREVHEHVAILRVDMDGTLIEPYLSVRQCKQVAEFFEKKFGLRRAIDGSPKEAFYKGKDEVADLWLATGDKSGQETKDAFKKKGYVLTQGDRGQFILVNSKTGAPYNPARVSRLNERKVTDVDVRARFKDIDPASLPATDSYINSLNLPPHLKKNLKSQAKFKRASRAFVRRLNKGRRHSGGGSSGGSGSGNPAPTQAAPKISGAAHHESTPPREAAKPQNGGGSTPMPVTKGWPPEAIVDWETWGKQNPARFFAMWAKLAPEIFGAAHEPR